MSAFTPRWQWVSKHGLALALGLLLVVGGAFCLYGLNWDQNHHLHPDERAITAFVVPKIGMPPLREWPSFFNPWRAGEATEEHPNFFDPQTSPLNPRFFAYGSLPLYLLRLVANLLSLFPPLSRMGDYDHLTLLGRALSGLAGTANIYLVYLVGRRAHSKEVGLLAAAFSAFTVFEIQVAHFFAMDVFLNTFILLFFYFALGLAKGGGTKEAALAGASLGWALATKFSAAPLLLALIVALALRWRDNPKNRGETLRLAFLSLLCLSLAFFLAQPYAIIDRGAFWSRIVAEGEMVRGIRDYPYTRQYGGTTPFLYQITQTAAWAMGWPLGVVAWGGLLFALWRFRRWQREEILLLSWVLPYFLLTGSFYVKFLRYMLPLFPFLYILGARMLVAWKERVGKGAWSFALGVLLLSSLLYSSAFVSIYARPHSRVQASEWIYRHIPAGSVLTAEHWDDPLPLSLLIEGEGRSPAEYQILTMELYEPDDEAKYRAMVETLQKADYIVLSSNRLYGSIPRWPQRYPITTRYYELLFAERLGFKLVHTFTSYPRFLGFTIVDDRADESFTVYDHPKVLVFQKKRDLTEEEFHDLFAQALEPSAVAQEKPQGGKSLLLDEPVDRLPIIADRGWNGLANRHPLLSILTWWLALQLLGTLALPLALLLFRPLADGGYILAKTLGLLIVAYLVWLAASLRFLTNSLPTILLAMAILGSSSFLFAWPRRGEVVELLRSRKKAVLVSEAFFASAFLLLAGLRILNPDLWQPWTGGEKSMEFAYLNAITKSAHFPPYDPYFAGGYINYYYYGLHLVSVLIKLTGIVPSVAFNLAIPSLFALTVGNAFSLGYSLTRRYLGGVTAAGFVALLGNLDGLVQIAERLGDLSGLAFHCPIPGVEGLVRALPGLIKLLLGQGSLPPFDYWRSTRVIPFTINEFPYFSFLFADLHPHLIGIPVTIFLLALALILVQRPKVERIGFASEEATFLLILGLTLGAVAAINTWDLPTYFLVILGALLLRAWAQGGGPATVRAALAALGVVTLAVTLYIPFFAHYQPLYVGLGLVQERTRLEPFLTIWAFFLFLMASYFLLEVWRRLGRRHGAVAIVLISLPVLALAAMREWVLAVLLPLVVLAGLLTLLYDDPPERRFSHLLAFLGLAVLLGCEVAYLRDFLQGGEYWRMNTLFKFYIQAWVLLAITGAAVLPLLWRRLKRWGYVWKGAFLFLLLASSIYPVLGTKVRVEDRFPGARPPLGTLDGLAFMTVGVYHWPDQDHTIEMGYDYQAIEWFLGNVRGTPVVAEAPVAYYREGGLRIASYTGLPTLVGAHQNEQRYGWMVAERETDARRFYETTDLEETKRLMEKLHITYIYVGQLERIVYSPEALAKFDLLWEGGYLEMAYQNPKVKVYKVP